MKRHLLAASLLCLFALAPRAHAALGDQSMDPAANTGADSSDDSTPKVQQPPSPTPGSKAESAPVVDAAANAASLDPNAALFDAITRGDTDAARDAIARGADLNARNSLGQKPIDAAVDLGRNDITFVLLAERPLTSTTLANSTPTSSTSTGATSTGATFTGPQASEAPARTRTRTTSSVRQVSVTRPVNTGTPKPAVGFLGFQ